MKQLVFLKQVPASTEIRLDPVTHTLVRSGAKAQTNPDDLHALRAAVEIRNLMGGTITAITMGPPQAEAVLREAMMLGADEAVLLSDRSFAGSDTWSTSYILATAAQKVGGYDLLLFGKQAIDGDTAQVGPGVAARLSLPCLTEMISIRHISAKTITIEKVCDGGSQVLECQLPAAVTVCKEANELPAPTLRAWEMAQQKPILRWSAIDLALDANRIGLNGSPTRVVKTEVPETTRHIQWIDQVSSLSQVLIHH